MYARRRFPSGLLAAACWAGLLTGCQTAEDKKIDGVWLQNKPPRLDNASGRLPELRNLHIPEEGERRIDPETHLAAARLHESLGDNLEALEQYQKAVSLRPDYTEALNGLANLCARMGRFQEAEDAYRRAIESASDKAYLWNNRAFCYLMQRRWAEAEADLRYALELSPDFGRARINYAMVMAQQDRFDEAFTQFSMVLPKANAYYNLGLMYQSRRRTDEAAEAYRQALARDPGLVAAQRRLEKLPERSHAVELSDPQSMGSPPPMSVESAPVVERPAVDRSESSGGSQEGLEIHLPKSASPGSGSAEYFIKMASEDFSFIPDDLYPLWPIWQIPNDE